MSERLCDYCGTKLGGRRGHGFPVPSGKGLSCGRAQTSRTVVDSLGRVKLVKGKLKCAAVLG